MRRLSCTTGQNCMRVYIYIYNINTYIWRVRVSLFAYFVFYDIRGFTQLIPYYTIVYANVSIFIWLIIYKYDWIHRIVYYSFSQTYYIHTYVRNMYADRWSKKCRNDSKFRERSIKSNNHRDITQNKLFIRSIYNFWSFLSGFSFFSFLFVCFCFVLFQSIHRKTKKIIYIYTLVEYELFCVLNYFLS